ncbi:TPA: oligosaccharide flippase family protein [Vibrio parahaemolyticus]|nr:oligosaccharide flippase family protein [Vibrio parahaemolyticus]HCH5062467.1 oligosaccharide flippase family protein [Vibrio parahaemolyticus]
MKNNVIWLICDKSISVIISILSTYIISNSLGVDSFAIYSYNLSLLLILLAFSRLGLNQLLITRFTGKSNLKGIFFNGFFIKTISQLFFLVTFYFFIFRSDERVDYLFFMVSFFYVLEIYEFYFSSVRKFDVIAKSKIFINVSSLFIRWMLFVYEKDLSYFLFSYLFQFIGFYLILGVLGSKAMEIKSLECNVTRRRVIVLLKKTTPLWIASLSTSIFMQVDQLMIANLSTNYELGIYSLSVNIMNQLNMFTVVFCGFMLPYLRARYLKGKDGFFKYWYNINLTTFFGLLILSIFLYYLYPFLIQIWSEDFHGSEQIFKILVITLPMVFLNLSIYNYNVIIGRSYINMYSALLGSAVNLTLNYLLIPDYGAKGAAFSSAISYFIITFLFYLITDAKIILGDCFAKRNI